MEKVPLSVETTLKNWLNTASAQSLVKYAWRLEDQKALEPEDLQYTTVRAMVAAKISDLLDDKNARHLLAPYVADLRALFGEEWIKAHRMPYTPGERQAYRLQPPADELAVKFDAGKVGLDLLPAEALEEVARVLDHGAARYGAHNWREGMSWTRLIGAALRHTFAIMRGEDRDPETRLLHSAHAVAGLLFLTSYMLIGGGTDNRVFKNKETR